MSVPRIRSLLIFRRCLFVLFSFFSFLLLLSTAHNAILEGKTVDEAGTTTLIVGAVLPVDPTDPVGKSLLWSFSRSFS
jgi:hypothetical protein